jgi:hypothetical protein
MTTTPERVWPPPRVAGERDTLNGFLDYYRGTLVFKVAGLSDDDARRRMVPSLTTPAGVIKHMLDVEKWWFHEFIGGRDVTYFFTDDDEDGDWRVGDDEKLADLCAGYTDACATSREILAGVDLDQAFPHPRGHDLSVRWVVVHMIEETARHAGHMDILREQIDGQTGDVD